MKKGLSSPRGEQARIQKDNRHRSRRGCGLPATYNKRNAGGDCNNSPPHAGSIWAARYLLSLRFGPRFNIYRGGAAYFRSGGIEPTTKHLMISYTLMRHDQDKDRPLPPPPDRPPPPTQPLRRGDGGGKIHVPPPSPVQPDRTEPNPPGPEPDSGE